MTNEELIAEIEALASLSPVEWSHVPGRRWKELAVEAARALKETAALAEIRNGFIAALTGDAHGPQAKRLLMDAEWRKQVEDSHVYFATGGEGKTLAEINLELEDAE